MDKQTTFSTLAIASIFASTISFAVLAGSGLFEELDTDANGLISPNEAQAHEALSNNFDLVDINSDGAISKEELSATGL